MRALSGVPFGVLSFCMLVGCSLATSFDGLSSSRADDAAVDGPIVVEAGSGPDGTAPGDGGDASVDYCAGATFCDDFERADLLGPWTNTNITTGASVTLTSARAHAGMSCERAAIGTVDGAEAALEKDLPSASRMHLTFFLFLASAPASVLNVTRLIFHYPSKRGEFLFFALGGNNISFYEQEFANGAFGFTQELKSVPFPQNKWVKLELELDLVAMPATITWTMDGTSVVTKLPLSRSYGAATSTLISGISYAGKGTSDSVDIDDVRVDVTP